MKNYRTAILNQKFGKLTVIEFLRINRWGQTVWKCRCDCGKETEGLISPLKSGNKQSCGCLENIKGKSRKTWRGHEDISLTRFNAMKMGAKKRNLLFDISIEQIWDIFLKQDKKCALSGVTLSFGEGKWDSNGNASLDRIDSEKGYVVGNVQWVDKRVNFMKQGYTMDEFVRLCRLISQKQGSLI